MGPLNSVDICHSKLGSINKHRLQQIQKNINVIFLFHETSLNFCGPCIIGKKHRLFL